MLEEAFNRALKDINIARPLNYEDPNLKNSAAAYKCKGLRLTPGDMHAGQAEILNPEGE